MSAPVDLSDRVGDLHPPNAAEVEAARRTAAEHAHDADDLRGLLAVLGIGPTDEETP